jgi:His-Xaa-Ser system radical SAM maturase HxsB
MGQAKFESRQFYQPMSRYRLLPFRFLQFDQPRKMVVNEVGEYLLLNNEDFDAFVAGQLSPSSHAYLDLKGKHFLFDTDSPVPFELLAVKYRTKKSHLAGFTKLHIFVLTLRCEHSCLYCQASRVSQDKSRYDMSPETASRALGLVFRSPADSVKIELQGGEPLLHFERITQVLEEAERRSEQTGKSVEFVVATNLALATTETLEYLRDHRVLISTTLDGPEFIHNTNRPRPGNDSYQRTVENIGRAREILGWDRVAAIMTATRLTLKHPREVVDEYHRLGFHSIFLRPVRAYGFAAKAAGGIGYPAEEFVRFYLEALDYILQLNRKGMHLVETYAQIVLTKILTPFATAYVDLQSPAGAGIGVAVYNYDGDVYASDESRMLAENGDKQFRLGNVHADSYEQIFGGKVLRAIVASSCIESLPGCADCAFQPFCGADPVFHYVTQGDMVGHRPTSDFHKINFLIIKHLVHLYHTDPTARRIFWAWVRNVDVRDLLDGQTV